MQAESGRQKLTILHTNDIHSHFETMSSVAAIISREKEAAGQEHVLVLDVGDHMDRAAAETEGTMGQANVDVLNLTGYDAITIGNNEGLTIPPETLGTIYAGLQCPVVCCNILETGTGTPPPWMKPYILLEKGGITIGIIGATAAFSGFYQLLGWDALEPEQAIAEQVRELRDKTDLIIVLSHLGLTIDKRLAENVDGIDVILGGHTHHVLEEPLIIERTAVCAAGKFGAYVGKIVLERKTRSEPFDCKEGRLLSVTHELLEPEVEHAIIRHRQRAEETLSETIAVTARDLPIHYERESPFANLLAQAVRRHTGAQLSVVNAGQLLGPLPGGEISTGMLHALCPSPINPCIIKLSGSDLVQALEESLLEEFSGKKIFGFGFRGYILGALAVDGMEIRYDASAEPYRKISKITVQGEPLDRSREYTVGTLDMFTFKVGYETLSHGQDTVYMLPEFIRDLLRDELSRPGALEQTLIPRWLD
ncbi:bifunctional UDP-sugar hydrolase/5'-nucleotidase [Paenibacillus sp. 7541]|uniref:bifunctional metallophosphatase/5'-nucleotidase n=1 Tax=Paenibacillus sp. 7541 TaxID=2026236 RepID=UPI000BA6D78C|nr:bifunctional UDP-sugar hydrolase/5'-nucleotidase [Paenibacillus sp. 7541]PAK49402.1 multifunctional 2',3'-cyclic-nucleotide 2'-phosphodiesterase/5'-nucleotidase/3'-nucleotidase [Paenibacillus sp. 7541]